MLEFCGGEPTVRHDLPEIIRSARSMGFDHIQINSNGIRLAQDIDYLRALKEAGASVIYLQFDATDDEVYQKMRHQALFDIKCKAISNCTEVQIGVVLVPTLVKDTNLHLVGEIIRFAKNQIPTVRGVFFQPLSYFGRYPEQPDDERRLTIPDVLNAIEQQTNGELKIDHFSPPGCESAHCSFSGFAVRDAGGRLIPTTRYGPRQEQEDPTAYSMMMTKKIWRYPEEEPESQAVATHSSFSKAIARTQRDTLFISGMAFQDVWNVDLERLRHCSIQIVSRDGRLIPLCAKYLTAIDGTRLYPGMA